MKSMAPMNWDDVATKTDITLLKADISVFRGELNADLAAHESRMLRALATWLFTSQAVLVAVVSLVVAIFG